MGITEPRLQNASTTQLLQSQRDALQIITNILFNNLTTNTSFFHIQSKLCIPISPYILKQWAQTSSSISDEHNHIGNFSLFPLTMQGSLSFTK